MCYIYIYVSTKCLKNKKNTEIEYFLNIFTVKDMSIESNFEEKEHEN